MLRASARVPEPFGQLRLLRDLTAFVRVNFLHVGVRLDLFTALRRGPRSAEELAAAAGVVDREALTMLLDLGVALGELRRAGPGRYRLTGRRAATLARRRAAAALVEETVAYHGTVYQGLPDLLRGGAKGDHLRTMAETVAESSRILEPFTAAFVRDAVRGLRAPRVLDVGCGSGTYLATVARAVPDASGVGLDVQPRAVDLSRRALAAAHAGDRFVVRQGNAMDDPQAGPFDVVLLLNNVYYFTDVERQKLFRSLRDSLGERGRLLIASMFHGPTPTALNFSLVLWATKGCHPLPRLAHVVAELRDSGFSDVRATRLAPLEPYVGLVASR
ncbi:MAG TPA: class I SAM-dependent methyltransferase [Pilimelia sp.]|nr:class I SAM-dependent methyltransferase [Pilimelia sp.]